MARRKMRVMRCGNVSDAVTHSAQALVTDATTAPAIRRLSLSDSGKCISDATTRVKTKKGERERGSGSTHLSHFFTQFDRLPLTGKKKHSHNIGIYYIKQPPTTTTRTQANHHCRLFAARAAAAVASFRGRGRKSRQDVRP